MSSPRSPREESVEEMETEVTPEPNGELLWKCGVCVILCLCLVWSWLAADLCVCVCCWDAYVWCALLRIYLATAHSPTESADTFAFSGRAYLIKEHTHINMCSLYESWMLASAKSVAWWCAVDHTSIWLYWPPPNLIILFWRQLLFFEKLAPLINYLTHGVVLVLLYTCMLWNVTAGTLYSKM